MTLNELHRQGWLKDSGALESAARLLQMNEGGDADDHETTGVARVLMGIGAWLSGLFLCGFIGFAFRDWFGPKQSGFAVIGLIAIAIGVAIQRFGRQVFIAQLGLAISVAGHLAMAIGLFDFGTTDFLSSLVAFALLCPVIYWLSGNAVQRFMSVSMVWLMLLLNAFDDDWHGWLLAGVVAAVTALGLLMSGRLFQHWLRPAALATLMWLFVLMFCELSNWSWYGGKEFDSVIYTGMVVALGTAGLLFYLLQPRHREAIVLGIFAVLLVGLALARAPGLVASLGLVAVAHARRDRPVEWLSWLALGVFLVQFYHFLGATLLVKSIVLMVSGAVLMVVSGYLTKFAPAKLRPREMSGDETLTQ